MQILTRARRKAFESVPQFNVTERDCYFSIDKSTRKALRQFRTPDNRVAFLVQRAYFQAKGCFFEASEFAASDIKKAAYNLGIRSSLDISSVSKKVLNRQKALILNAHGWKAYSEQTRAV